MSEKTGTCDKCQILHVRPPLIEFCPTHASAVEEVAEVRKFFWLNHGCSIAALYGDDGEMQCGNCKSDFKRDSIESLVSFMTMRMAKRFEAVEEVERYRLKSLPSGKICAGCKKPIFKGDGGITDNDGDYHRECGDYKLLMEKEAKIASLERQIETLRSLAGDQVANTADPITDAEVHTVGISIMEPLLAGSKTAMIVSKMIHRIHADKDKIQTAERQVGECKKFVSHVANIGMKDEFLREIQWARQIEAALKEKS